MQHRHLTSPGFRLAALDDLIERGSRADWAALRKALQQDPALRPKILRLCAPRLADPSAQRYYFWHHYVLQQSA